MTKIKAFFLTLSLVGLGAPAFAAPPSPVGVEKPAGEVITAKVNGLVCDFCAQSMKKVFGKEKAVSKVDVNLTEGVVRLTLKPGLTLDDARIGKLIKKSGYALVSIERKAA
jgi:copper chaperone CopZ